MAGYKLFHPGIFSLFIFSSLCFSGDTITIDGLFQDWEQVRSIYSDDMENLSEDFAELKITNDNSFLFIYFSFYNSEQLLQDNNSIRLLIDSDNDKETGHPLQNLGAELEWCFGCKSGYHYVQDGIISIKQNDLVLRTAPTITSQFFECAISLDSWPLALNTQNQDTLIILLQNSQLSDFLPDNLSGFKYVIDTAMVNAPKTLPLNKFDQKHLRILSYNTLANGLLTTDRQPHFKRVIEALNPDILAFQEQGRYKNVETLMIDWLQKRPLYSVGLGNGNMVVSKYPILKQAILTRSGRTMATLLDTKDHLGDNLLLLNSHLACCENNASRQKDADELASVLRDWKLGNGPFPLPENTPIVHVGDFNLVGYSQQLLTLTDGDIVDEFTYGADAKPDWDNTPFADLFSRHNSIRMGYTWRDDRSEFSPGKLDYILFSDSNVKIGNHYILNTLAMSQQDLNKYSLEKEDTNLAADHLPRVVDIYLAIETGVQSLELESNPDQFELYSPYPNPFNATTQIQFSLPKESFVQLEIINVNGQLIKRLANGIFTSGDHILHWDSRLYSSGVYICKLTSGNYSKSVKVLLQK